MEDGEGLEKKDEEKKEECRRVVRKHLISQTFRTVTRQPSSPNPRDSTVLISP